MHAKKRFTLIELLVTIAIIAILASLLLPSLKTARDKGKQISCAGNLKSWGQAKLFYAGDYNGWSYNTLSSLSTGWRICLYSYLGFQKPGSYPSMPKGSASTCPSDTNPYLTAGTCYSSYGDNSWADGQWEHTFIFAWKASLILHDSFRWAIMQGLHTWE